MLQTRYASFIKRFVAYVVDKLILSLLLVPLAVLAIPDIVSSLLYNPWIYFDLDYDAPLFIEAFFSSLPLAAILVYFLAFIFVSFLYFALFESSGRQATPGKMLVGIFVADEQGRRISFWRALGRTLGKILSKFFCYLGYIIVLFTERSQALHDLLACTLVLEPDLRPAPPQMTAVPGYPAPAPGRRQGAPQGDTPAPGGESAETAPGA